MWLISERDINGNVIITPRTVLDFEKCFGISFSVSERKLLFRMKTYAAGAIASLEGNIKDDD